MANPTVSQVDFLPQRRSDIDDKPSQLGIEARKGNFIIVLDGSESVSEGADFINKAVEGVRKRDGVIGWVLIILDHDQSSESHRIVRKVEFRACLERAGRASCVVQAQYRGSS